MIKKKSDMNYSDENVMRQKSKYINKKTNNSNEKI